MSSEPFNVSLETVKAGHVCAVDQTEVDVLVIHGFPKQHRLHQKLHVRPASMQLPPKPLLHQIERMGVGAVYLPNSTLLFSPRQDTRISHPATA